MSYETAYYTAVALTFFPFVGCLLLSVASTRGGRDTGFLPYGSLLFAPIPILNILTIIVGIIVLNWKRK